MFFEAEVVVGLNLLEQDWFKLDWDQSGAASPFERGQVVQISVKLQIPVDAGGADSEHGCDFFWCFLVVLDGLDDSGSEVYRVGFHV